MVEISLAGKNAVVTGGSRGIGQEIVVRLAEAGARVITNYNTTPPDETKRRVEEVGGTLIALPCDFSQAASVDGFADTITKEYGGADILVHNAGIARDNLLVRMSEDEWDDVMTVNMKSVFLLTRGLSKGMMKKRSGSIILISSVVGAMGNPGQCNYAASKGALVAFGKSLARELAGRNVRVNSIAPGYIATDMTDKLSSEIKDKLLETIPMKAMGTPKQIADAVLFLASDFSSYVTGETMHVNGGMFMP